MKKTYYAPASEPWQLDQEEALLTGSETTLSGNMSGSDMDDPDDTQNPF